MAKIVTQRSVNPAGRQRARGQAYASWTDTESGIPYELLKSWQTNNGQLHARWMVASGGQFAEMGDMYVQELWKGLQWARDIVFDPALWENKTRFLEWAQGTGGR